MDPEMRRMRLERIAKAQRHRNSSSFTLKEVPYMKIEKSYENAPESIFELNSRLGVDKYLFEGDIHLTE